MDAETGAIKWRSENEYLDLLGLSPSERNAAKATLEASQELDRKIARLTYQMNRIEMKANAENAWDVYYKIYDEKFYEFEDLDREKRALKRKDRFGEVVSPSNQIGNGHASYTPTSDGKRVFTCFGTGVVVALDLEGNRLWHRMLDHPDHMYGGSTSPVLADDVLIVRFSDYVGLDKVTGEELWRRSSGLTFGTPSLFRVEGEAYVMTPRGGVIRARDGESIVDDFVPCNSDTDFLEAFSAPLVSDGCIYFQRGAHDEKDGTETSVAAYRIPSRVDDLKESISRSVWKTHLSKTSFYASPLAHEGLLYVAGRDRILRVLEADTGDIVYKQKIKEARDPLFSSITLAGRSIFLGSEDGVALFIEPGRRYLEKARSRLPLFRSTPIFAGDVAYLRTWEGVYAYGRN